MYYSLDNSREINSQLLEFHQKLDWIDYKIFEVIDEAQFNISVNRLCTANFSKLVWRFFVPPNNWKTYSANNKIAVRRDFKDNTLISVSYSPTEQYILTISWQINCFLWPRILACVDVVNMLDKESLLLRWSNTSCTSPIRKI